MFACINKNLPEYKMLQQRSGLPEEELEAACRSFLDKYDRFPYLDELTEADSENALREQLHINQQGAIDIEEALSSSGHETVEELTRDVNNQFRDKEVTITPIITEAMVDIKKRPTITNMDVQRIEVDTNPDNVIVFNNALVKLGSLYGIEFKGIDDSQLEQFPPEVKTSTAFVYNGDIYINLDKASVDAPLHEMMHIFAGSLRFSNPDLYREIVSSVEQLPNYEQLSSRYPNRTRLDVNEEIFIEQTARYLTGMSSVIGTLDPKVLYEISYNIKRVLDTILMGLDSVRTLAEEGMYHLSLKQVALEVNSSIMNNSFRGFINTAEAAKHRKINNLKSELLLKHLLREECD